MSDSLRRNRKTKKPVKKEEVKPVFVEEKVTLADVLHDEPEKPQVKQPDPPPEKVEKEAMPKEKSGDPVIVVDAEKFFRWAARLKTGGFGIWMNGANFANHMIKDCVKVDKKEISIPEASQLIRPHTFVKG